MKRRGPPTPESFRLQAEKNRKHFSPQNVIRKLGVHKPVYYYVYGITLKGKQLFLGPIPQDEAETIASSLDSGEVFESDYKDQARATREIKAELFRRGIDPDVALSRMSHRQE